MVGGRVRAAAWVAAASAMVAGCTLLIPFDEVPGDDAGVDASLPPRAQDAAQASDGAAQADAPADAAADVVDLDALTTCKGKTNGLYCGNNQLGPYPGSKDDLVTCDGGKVAYVKSCDSGIGCVHMPNPKPDQCDECKRKSSDGFYCGRDMPGWAAENANVRVQCQAGGVVGTLVCATSCTSNGAQSKCAP